MTLAATAKRIAAFAAIALAAAAAYAHPHMKLTSRLEFVFDGGACTGFWADWTFDPVFSAAIIGERDLDRNGVLSAAESDAVYAKAFSNLRKYGYFTFFRAGKKRINPEGVRDFKARIEGGLLAYRFFVALPPGIPPDDFHLAIIDTTFFCAVEHGKEAAAAKQLAEGGPAPRISMSQNKDYPVIYDPQGGIADKTIYTEMKPGLQKAYPEEFHVSFAAP